MSSTPKNADASGTNGNPEDVAIDNKLRDLFTDGSGIVRGVCSTRNVPGKDTHYQLADGTVHTFHVYGDENAATRTNLYVPKSFSKIEQQRKQLISIMFGKQKGRYHRTTLDPGTLVKLAEPEPKGREICTSTQPSLKAERHAIM